MGEREGVFGLGASGLVDDQFDLIGGAADDFDRAEDVVDLDGFVGGAGKREGFLDDFVVLHGQIGVGIVAESGVGVLDLKRAGEIPHDTFLAERAIGRRADEPDRQRSSAAA